MPIRIALLSAVNGGPVDRLVEHLNASGRARASVRSLFTTVEWRERRGQGGLGSIAARLLVMLLYPWYALLAIRSSDLLITTTNPFWMPNLALMIQRFHRRPIVTLVYDVYPDSLGDTGHRPHALLSLMHRMNAYWMTRSDAVVFISISMRDEMTRRYGQPRRQRVIVTGVDSSEFHCSQPQPDLEAWLSDRTLVSYVGNAGRAHDVETVSAVLNGTLQQLTHEVAVFVSASGERAPQLRQALEDAPHVRFEGALDEERWAWVQARSDIAVVSLHGDSAFSSMPSKYFSALGAGCAVFVVAPRTTDLYQLTATHEVGVAVEPGDWTNGVARLTALIESPSELRSMQERARQVAIQHFDLGVLSSSWLELFDEIDR